MLCLVTPPLPPPSSCSAPSMHCNVSYRVQKNRHGVYTGFKRKSQNQYFNNHLLFSLWNSFKSAKNSIFRTIGYLLRRSKLFQSLLFTFTSMRGGLQRSEDTELLYQTKPMFPSSRYFGLITKTSPIKMKAAVQIHGFFKTTKILYIYFQQDHHVVFYIKKFHKKSLSAKGQKFSHRTGRKFLPRFGNKVSQSISVTCV